MSQRVVLASRNAKKLNELRSMLAPCGLALVPVSDFPNVPEVEETGNTFEENARLKAESVSQATGLPAIADDSGLVVDALDGAPGVYSARFAGPEATDEINNRLLLEKLADVSDEKRTAAFHCVIAFSEPGETTRTFTGQTYGLILHNSRGANGFGYDPLFLSDDLGVSFAEADAAEKNRVSHRGRALSAFVAFCRERFGSGQ